MSEIETGARVGRLEALLQRVRANASRLAEQRLGQAAPPLVAAGTDARRTPERFSEPAISEPAISEPAMSEPAMSEPVRATYSPPLPSSLPPLSSASVSPSSVSGPASSASAPPAFASARPSSIPAAQRESYPASDDLLEDVGLESLPPTSVEELPSDERTNTDWLGGTTTNPPYEPDALPRSDTHRTLAETPAAKSGDSARAPEARTTDPFMAPDLETDQERALSDVPPPAIGATVALDEGAAVPLELDEPRQSISPSPSLAPESAVTDEESLEAELPRTSYTGFDASLSAPPSAQQELQARDRAQTERFASVPVSQDSGFARRAEDDLPPVLTQPPLVPASIEAPSVPGGARQTQIVGSHTATTGGASLSLEHQPAPDALPATFLGAAPESRPATFLELLDRSLSLTVRR